VTTSEILGRHDKFLDSLIDGFEERLDPLIDAARLRTLKALEKKLTIKDGAIEFTPANQRVLRSIARLFKTEMNRSTKQTPGGFKGLADAFSSQFADHLPKFEDVLNRISQSLKGPKLPPVKFTAADVDLFASQAIGAKEMLLDVLNQTASAGKRQALFGVGGLKFSDLADELAKQFGRTKSSALSIADTSVSMFYRTIASQSYKKIEETREPGTVRYEYAGPEDQLERPFCADLSHKAGQYTRAQIDAMDNGQGLPVFTACGGYNCRHQWILSVADEEAA
jgi:hypothetical protein